jgi:hypothetical protein
MRYRLVFALFLIAFSLRAQVGDTLRIPALPIDSISARYLDKFDSIQSGFYHDADSLKQSVQSMFVSLDTSRDAIQSKIDSLQHLQLPTGELTTKLDSIQNKRTELVQSLNQKVEDLKSKTISRVNDLTLPPELQSKVSSLTDQFENFQLPVKDMNIPPLNVPNNALSSLDGLNSAIPNLNGANLPGVEGLPAELSNLNGFSDQFSGYSQDLNQLTQGNLEQVQQLPQTIETKAAEVSGLNEIAKQAGELDPLVNTAKNPEAMKEEALQQAQQIAVDHFAGKEEQLKAAMDKISKLKRKYSSLNSLSEIPKKRPNEMRDKPLIERIVPGVDIQLQKENDDLLADFNPYVGYRVNGRLTSGIGWVQRVGYNTDQYTWSSKSTKVYGPRAYGEFKLSKGFAPRAELEVVNTVVPSRVLNAPATDVDQREWVWGAFVGIKKEYKFVKNVKGTAIVMLRLFNPEHKSPYADVLNVRFGFEFPMKKKVKKS